MNCREVKQTFRLADCVTFDIDSTVCTDEGIDELASFLNKGQEVGELTRLAMEGKVTYTDSLRRRLEIIRPSLEDFQLFRKQKAISFSPGIEALVKRLNDLRVPVYLITGGFYDLVDDVAKLLGVPKENVFANKILFDKDGKYGGFDSSQLTSRDTGKAEVIAELKKRYGFERLVHVGDGMTDASACPPADAFIGYGGNQVRERVRLVSKWYVVDFREMLDELNSRMIEDRWKHFCISRSRSFSKCL